MKTLKSTILYTSDEEIYLREKLKFYKYITYSLLVVTVSVICLVITAWVMGSLKV